VIDGGKLVERTCKECHGTHHIASALAGTRSDDGFCCDDCEHNFDEGLSGGDESEVDDGQRED